MWEVCCLLYLFPSQPPLCVETFIWQLVWFYIPGHVLVFVPAKKLGRIPPFGLLVSLIVSVGGYLYNLSFTFSTPSNCWDVALAYGSGIPMRVLLWWLSLPKIAMDSPLLDCWFPNLSLWDFFCPLCILVFQILPSVEIFLWKLGISFLCEWFCGGCPREVFARDSHVLDCRCPDLCLWGVFGPLLFSFFRSFCLLSYWFGSWVWVSISVYFVVVVPMEILRGIASFWTAGFLIYVYCRFSVHLVFPLLISSWLLKHWFRIRVYVSIAGDCVLVVLAKHLQGIPPF